MREGAGEGGRGREREEEGGPRALAAPPPSLEPARRARPSLFLAPSEREVGGRSRGGGSRPKRRVAEGRGKRRVAPSRSGGERKRKGRARSAPWHGLVPARATPSRFRLWPGRSGPGDLEAGNDSDPWCGPSCSIVCFVSLLGPDEIFEWSDAWPPWRKGFVDSLSHRKRTSIPFFQVRRMRTAGSACAGGHTQHKCIAGLTFDGGCNPKKRSNITS